MNYDEAMQHANETIAQYEPKQILLVPETRLIKLQEENEQLRALLARALLASTAPVDELGPDAEITMEEIRKEAKTLGVEVQE